jgi:NTP pyrophosphatase (non-canonical NTP hydrolase)
MSNCFSDQKKFMIACEQTVGSMNDSQFKMYLNLINEEMTELCDAISKGDKVETLDALMDIIVVTIGAVHSMNVDGEGAWKEVMGSNFSKIDRQTGKVNLREDGKVLKPFDWKKPELEQYIIKGQ